MVGVYISFISLAFLLQAHYFYIVYMSFISLSFCRHTIIIIFVNVIMGS